MALAITAALLGGAMLVLRSFARIILAAMIAVVIVSLCSTPTMAQPFNPVRQLTTWYTDQGLIDIEIVGSSSLQPDAHRLEPDRLLRLRLERAYVQTLLTQSDRGYEIVRLAFDSETSLASALLTAASRQGRFHEDIAGVPKLAHRAVLQRTLLLSLRSDVSSALVERSSASIGRCRGAPLGNDLFAYVTDGQGGCARSSRRQATHYVAQHGDLLLSIACSDTRPNHLGCKLQFPFEGFGVEMTFHIEHLSAWHALVERATAFLKSKQYQGP
jgi:hypothetical protein